jgi:hypothetical protein
MSPIGMPVTMFRLKQELISVMIDVSNGKSHFHPVSSLLTGKQVFTILQMKRMFYIATSAPTIFSLFETIMDL